MTNNTFSTFCIFILITKRFTNVCEIPEIDARVIFRYFSKTARDFLVINACFNRIIDYETNL